MGSFVLFQCHPNSYINIIFPYNSEVPPWIDLIAQYELLFLYGIVKGNYMETIVFLALISIFLWAMSDDDESD